MRATAVVVAVGVMALAAGGRALAQGTRQTGQTQQPTYGCSVKVPQGGDRTMAGLAKITLAQAIQAAQAAVPGQVLRSSLDNENGCLVYSVEIRSGDGQFHDVKVDAGTAAVVHQETGTRLGSEHEGPGEVENGAED